MSYRLPLNNFFQQEMDCNETLPLEKDESQSVIENSLNDDETMEQVAARFNVL